jgi:electron transport complex protein RnfB
MVLAILSICLIGAGYGPGSGWAARKRGTQRDRLVDRIDRLLPQTQCGKCNFKGCRPYAEAIAAGQAEINQCPPGGEAGIRALARLLGREPLPLNPENGVEKPAAVAVIDEQACIGCTLCIQACPVDAILGAMKQMHTVIADECTGCELCIPPCPVDCIVMQDKPVERARRIGERLFRFHGGLRLPQMVSAGRARAELARNRFLARESRLERLSQKRDHRLSEKKRALRDSAITRSEPLARDES